MDDKQSSLKEQLVVIKEKLNKAVLDKEIMEAEQGELGEALTKVLSMVSGYTKICYN